MLNTTLSRRPWVFLLAAILTEVVGVMCMKLTSASNSVLALLFMYSMVGLSFYFLAVAVERIPIALAYAVWEASGLTLITLVGFVYLEEPMNAIKLLGMVMVITGVVFINLGAPGESDVGA